MKISFVIPVYNSVLYIQKCIDSIINSELPNSEYEIIMIDDGSTDNSFLLCQNIANEFDNVYILSQENQGSSVARNNGLSHCKGDYVWFVDSDDFLESGELLKVYIQLKKNSVDILGIQLAIKDNDIHYLECTQYNIQHNITLTGKESILNGFHPSSACALIFNLRFLITNHLEFVEGISHQDVEFTLRAVTLAKRILFTDIVAYNYIKHDGSVSRAIDRDKHYFYLIGDMHVAISHIKFAKQIKENDLRDNIIKRSNGIILGLLANILSNRRNLIDSQLRIQIINDLQRNCLYPLHGPYLNYKLKLYSIYLNLKTFLFLRS